MTAWVIERYYGDRRSFWNGRLPDLPPWAWKPDEAIRFADKASAEVILAYHCDGVGRIVELGKGGE